MFKPINLGSNSHTPPLPREEHIIGDGFAPLDTDQFGLHHLYNVARSNDVTASILELLEEPEKIALQQYQAWTELGWKTQHGTEHH